MPKPFRKSSGACSPLPALRRSRCRSLTASAGTCFRKSAIAAPSQGGLFSEAEAEIPDLIRVLDLQQEQLARSLGEGHRVIHGVAGSGKTLILGYRAEHLAKICSRPILVLCYNRTLAKRLASTIAAKGLADKVLVHTFHQWCRAQLLAYNAGLPEKTGDDNFYFAEVVDRIIRAVDANIIPAGQYDAVMIDEGHDLPARMAQACHPDGQPEYQLAARPLRRCPIHLRPRKARQTQLQKPRHPGPGPHHHPQDQLPQHPGSP